MPWLWDSIETLNSTLFLMKYGKKLNGVEDEEIIAFEKILQGRGDSYEIRRMRDVFASDLVRFFENQPQEAFRFFNPHGFDQQSIHKLQRNKAFLGYVIIDLNSSQIAAYGFNRSYFHGKGFRGRMVDINYRGKGLGTMMNRLLNAIGFSIGLRLFETVSKDNVASYKSAVSASQFKIVEELPHNELYLEIINDMKQKNDISANSPGGVKNK